MTYSPAAENRKRRIHHVVVIYDDPVVLDYLRQILEHRTHLHLLSHPGDALEGLIDVPGPDLSLIDCHLGDGPCGTSALELLADIQKRWPFVPMVMMSCSGDVQGTHPRQSTCIFLIPSQAISRGGHRTHPASKRSGRPPRTTRRQGNPPERDFVVCAREQAHAGR